MNIQSILGEIEKCGDLASVARSHGLKRRELKRQLYLFGGERGKAILIRELEKKLPADKIKDELNKNKSFEEICEILQIGIAQLEDWIQKYEFISGVPFKRKVGHKARKDLDSQFEMILQDYLDGESYPALSRKYGASSTAIRTRIEKYIYSNKPEEAEELKAKHHAKMQVKKRKKMAKKRRQNGNDVKGDENR